MKFKGNCNYCQKFGHKKVDCFKFKKDQKEKGENEDNAELTFVCVEEDLLSEEETEEEELQKDEKVEDVFPNVNFFGAIDGWTDVDVYSSYDVFALCEVSGKFEEKYLDWRPWSNSAYGGLQDWIV